MFVSDLPLSWNHAPMRLHNQSCLILSPLGISTGSSTCLLAILSANSSDLVSLGFCETASANAGTRRGRTCRMSVVG